MKKFSWTVSIILINFVILVSIELLGGPTIYNLLKFGGQWGPLVANGEWYRVVTAMFVHAGWLHLLFNMYALYYLGLLVEGIYGSSKFLFVYFITGVVGNLLSQVFYFSVPSVGASGAIFGLVGLLLSATYFRKDFPSVLRRSLLVSLVPMVIFNIAYGFIPGTDINNAAHLGGFATGLFLGYLISPGQSWAWKKKVWKTLEIGVLLTTVASFVGLANNNSIVTLQPTVNFANSYSKIIYELDNGYTPSKIEIELLKPFDKETTALKNDLDSYLENGTPSLNILNQEYERWIEKVKTRYKGLIRSTE
ncbi:rhomboid family intramembrane serine protease [Mesoaciditoga lauensis]|uniref:rhomboid family intramembrane serine protease n=1 Tax=Mesoaciditoga lauensis TaxID=1495039 RepID=UPI0009DDEFAA|nr:rhomboid family intramembrane serine protease [Mesoaciditoga lauensis]